MPCCKSGVCNSHEIPYNILITHRYTFRLSYIDHKGPMLPTIPNNCHLLDDLLWRILGNCPLNVIGNSTKLEAVMHPKEALEDLHVKKTKGHSFGMFIQSAHSKPALVVYMLYLRRRLGEICHAKRRVLAAQIKVAPVTLLSKIAHHLRVSNK